MRPLGLWPRSNTNLALITPPICFMCSMNSAKPFVRLWPPKSEPRTRRSAKPRRSSIKPKPVLRAQLISLKSADRAIGQASHFVDLDRGVRRNGQLIASDIRAHIAMMRTIAQHEHLSQSSLDRIDKAERVVPKMQATIECVSGYVRQQVNRLALPPPVSYALHAHLMPSCYL